MTKYNRCRAEMETTIRFDAEEKTAHIYTADPVYLRKLDKLTETNPESYRLIWTEPGGGAKKYEAPARLIRFGKPASEAQKESARRNTQFFAQNARNPREKNASSASDV